LFAHGLHAGPPQSTAVSEPSFFLSLQSPVPASAVPASAGGGVPASGGGGATQLALPDASTQILPVVVHVVTSVVPLPVALH
jgi:hypothetical protein